MIQLLGKELINSFLFLLLY